MKTQYLLGCFSILATGAETVPDMWKAILGLSGVVLLGVTIYKMMGARIQNLEIEMALLRKEHSIKEDRYVLALTEAAKFKALYEALKGE